MLVWSKTGPVRWPRVLLAVAHALFHRVLTHGLKPSVSWH
jgi:hypothetical protein